MKKTGISEVTKKPDLKAIEELAATIWREHYTPIIGVAQVEYMLQKLQSVDSMSGQIKEGYKYFSIFKDNTLVGYFSFLPERDALFLSKIYIEASQRGKGLSKEALNFIESKATDYQKNAIRLTVNKYNTGSIQAYLKMGFVKTRALVIDIGNGFVMDDYEMVKTISLLTSEQIF